MPVADGGSDGMPTFGAERRIARPTAAAQILAELRSAILAMRLPPGTPLVEKTLTERFGVSRTPVREALIRLSQERLVDIFPQAGTFVADPLGETA